MKQMQEIRKRDNLEVFLHIMQFSKYEKSFLTILIGLFLENVIFYVKFTFRSTDNLF